ncbi:MAG TPA: hypothetical protein VGD63_15845 [Steroidobacteraceae bacterium]
MNHIYWKRMALVALCSCSALSAYAADPIPPETQMVAASNAAPPVQETFTISTAEDLIVTLTDLQIPAEMVSAGVVVTQGSTTVATAQLAAPATSATLTITGAVGVYTLYVFGVPNPNDSVGTFSVCVAPKASPSNCIQGASLSGNITLQSSAQDPTVSTLSTSLTVSTAGAYTFAVTDLDFPAALSSPATLALLQGSTLVQAGITSGSSLTLSPGAYTLLAIARADQTVKSGLYTVLITGPAGTAPLLSVSVSVGVANAGIPFNNPMAQSVMLKVTDYGFPALLTSASALLTAGAVSLGMANSSGGASTFAAPMGTLMLWTYAAPGASAGTFSVDVSGSTDLHTFATGIQPVTPSGTYAYAFVTQPLAAGAYQATAADLQFPGQLSGLGFAVAQNGVILQQSATAATVNFTAASGNAVLLASAQVPQAGAASSSGLFDVNVQSTGATAQLIYDKTQVVSAGMELFNSQALNIGVSGNFDATLSDLQFPSAFSNLALVVSQGSNILGKIFGGGKFTFGVAPGTYQLTFLATPATGQEFGLYGVSVSASVPVITFTSDVASVTAGSTANLSWTVTNATSCSASGGSFTGNQPATSGKVAVQVAATTMYTLTCMGAGGSSSQTVTVTATAAPAKSGGGGSVDPAWLLLGSALWLARLRRSADDRP